MYVLKLIYGDRELLLSQENGYLISTIKGLTGVSASLSVMPNGAGIGTTYIDGTLSGNQIAVQGYILDGNTEKRRELLDFLAPMREITVVIYDIADVYSHRYTPYRQTYAVVMQTPQLSQVHHGKFAFVLYQPVPVWYEMQKRELLLADLGTATVQVEGQVEAEFNLLVKPTVLPMKDFSLYLDGFSGKSLYLDMRRYDEDGLPAGTYVIVQSKRGKVIVTVQGVEYNQCLYLDSTLFSLPVGEHTLTMSGDGTPLARFDYYPAYVGVALHC